MSKNRLKLPAALIAFCAGFVLMAVVMSFKVPTQQDVVRYDIEYYSSYNDSAINNRAADGWRIISSHTSGRGFELVWEKRI